MSKILCFGELLLRLSPDLNGDWQLQNKMPAYIGGAELNVATALANWNLPVSYCTALPANFMTDHILHGLSNKGIDVSKVDISGDRMGIYYLQQGSDLKNTSVVYDRSGSSFAQLKPGEIDWDEVFENIGWFHFSAISPALSQYTADLCKEALQAASKKGIKISVDLNYRSKLWQYGKQPTAIMPALVDYCDVVMGNIWSANSLLGMPLEPEMIHRKESYQEYAWASSLFIMQQFSKCKTVAHTFRFDQNTINYYATLFHQNKLYCSKEFYCDTALGKIGSGDCFMAGLIYGLYQAHNPQIMIDFAASAAFGKLQELGDATTQTIEQILERL